MGRGWTPYKPKKQEPVNRFFIETGFVDQAAKDLNRSFRDEIERKAAAAGMSNAAAYALARGDLTNNSVLQDIINRIPSGPPAAPPPPPPAPPAPPVPQNNYADQIKALEEKLAEREAAPAVTPPPDLEPKPDETDKFKEIIDTLRINSENQIKQMAEQYNATIGGLSNTLGGLRGELANQAAAYQQSLADLTKQQEAFQIRQSQEQKAFQESQAAGQRTYQANQARSMAAPSLQIQSAGQAPQTAGTQAFKRRANQFKIEKVFSGLNIGQPSTLNI